MNTATYNPRTFSTISPIGDYIAQYRTSARKARKITLANLPSLKTYAADLRQEETPREADRQLWRLYAELKEEAAQKIDNAFKIFLPVSNPAETRTAILADYTRAVLVAISDERSTEE